MVTISKMEMAAIVASLLVMSDSFATAVTPDRNPFSSISDRNCFGLKTPPVLTPPQPTNELPEVKITGFVKNNKGIRVLLAILSKDPRFSTKYLNLAEGEHDELLEVRKISMITGEAEVLLNATTKTTLSLKVDGMAAVVPAVRSATQPPAMPAIPTRSIPFAPLPSNMPSGLTSKHQS